MFFTCYYCLRCCCYCDWRFWSPSFYVSLLHETIIIWWNIGEGFGWLRTREREGRRRKKPAAQVARDVFKLNLLKSSYSHEIVLLLTRDFLISQPSRHKAIFTFLFCSFFHSLQSFLFIETRRQNSNDFIWGKVLMIYLVYNSARSPTRRVKRLVERNAKRQASRGIGDKAVVCRKGSWENESYFALVTGGKEDISCVIDRYKPSEAAGRRGNQTCMELS